MKRIILSIIAIIIILSQMVFVSLAEEPYENRERFPMGKVVDSADPDVLTNTGMTITPSKSEFSAGDYITFTVRFTKEITVSCYSFAPIYDVTVFEPFTKPSGNSTSLTNAKISADGKSCEVASGSIVFRDMMSRGDMDTPFIKDAKYDKVIDGYFVIGAWDAISYKVPKGENAFNFTLRVRDDYDKNQKSTPVYCYAKILSDTKNIFYKGLESVLMTNKDFSNVLPTAIVEGFTVPEFHVSPDKVVNVVYGDNDKYYIKNVKWICDPDSGEPFEMKENIFFENEKAKYYFTFTIVPKNGYVFDSKTKFWVLDATGNNVIGQIKLNSSNEAEIVSKIYVVDASQTPAPYDTPVYTFSPYTEKPVTSDPPITPSVVVTPASSGVVPGNTNVPVTPVDTGKPAGTPDPSETIIPGETTNSETPISEDTFAPDRTENPFSTPEGTPSATENNEGEATANPTASPGEKNEEKNNKGIIIGIVSGVLGCGAIAGIIILILKKKKK